jgi:NAD(P)-dependent dehydrogenase (short-subunit alcohol dehydrogenase family)
MNLNIQGKKALVTGGRQGIGKAIADGLRDEGVEVFTTSRKDGFDLMDENGPNKVFQTFKDIDILVNNAGSTFEISDPYCPISDWRKLLRLNLEVPIELSNLYLPCMKQKGWGRIVNISSVAGKENNGPVPFCTSKAALVAYTHCMGRVLATEGENIIMTAVLPGVILTDEGHWKNLLETDPNRVNQYIKERVPLGRLGTPDEIAPTVVYLCSQQAKFSHGGIFPADAGVMKQF